MQAENKIQPIIAFFENIVETKHIEELKHDEDANKTVKLNGENGIVTNKIFADQNEKNTKLVNGATESKFRSFLNKLKYLFSCGCFRKSDIIHDLS